jgi:glucosamine-6-phosphate deaminase
MKLRVFPDRHAMSRAAATHAARIVRAAIESRGTARIVAATGTSQIEFLERLTAAPGIDWRSVELFHLDEYVGISSDHPASFRRYLMDRFITKAGIVSYHLLDGERDAARVAEAVGEALAASTVDVAFAGIGENGHLAFNDPPADFETERPYLVVPLDAACRRQQVGEGWFPHIDEVPTHAISMSVRQILKSREIVCVVPEARKAAAVKTCVEGEISPMAPASILRTHANAMLFLDADSAAGLSERARQFHPE